jgi:hypothetical protein
VYMSTSNEVMLAPEDVFPRAPEHNPYNYTELDKKKRDLAIEAMMKDYPKSPQLWCEWIYDYVTNNPKDVVEDVINNNRWKVPSKRNNVGGEVTCGEILTADQYKELYGLSGYEKWLKENNVESD